MALYSVFVHSNIYKQNEMNVGISLWQFNRQQKAVHFPFWQRSFCIRKMWTNIENIEKGNEFFFDYCRRRNTYYMNMWIHEFYSNSSTKLYSGFHQWAITVIAVDRMESEWRMSTEEEKKQTDGEIVVIVVRK